MEIENSRNKNIFGRTKVAIVVSVLLLIAGFTAVQLYFKGIKAEISALNQTALKLESTIADNRAKKEKLCAEQKSLEEDFATIEDPVKAYTDAMEECGEYVVQFEHMVLDGKSNLKIAYLTFDDGPYDRTLEYMDVLKRNNAPATFFLRGRSFENYKDVYFRYIADGLVIGNHSFSHNIKAGLYDTPERFLKDIQKNRDYIQEKLGITTTIMRFPGGSGAAKVRGVKDQIVEGLHEMGYGYVDWNSFTGDGNA